MGNVHVHHGKLFTAAAVTLLIVIAVFSALLLAQSASAQPTFTTCATCHGMSATHGNANHTSFFSTCTPCHNNGGTSNPPLPSACGKCHDGVTAILGTAQHTTNGCGTTNGCHGYTSPTPTPTPTPSATPPATTTLTGKVSPGIVALGKKVKVSGLAGPLTALVGAKVALKVERKVGTKWLKMKTGTATTSATGAYAWSYKTAKKGAHRVTVSIAKTATFSAKKLVKTFKVK